jgi:hypothetical protein
MSGNCWKHLPDDFGSLENIESMDLSFNQLASVPSSISKLKSLKKLKLNRNNFTTLEDDLQYLDALEVLDLSENLLQAIPPCTVLMRGLKQLYLNRNSIGHTAVQPPLHKMSDLWHPFIHELTGQYHCHSHIRSRVVMMSILTSAPLPCFLLFLFIYSSPSFIISLYIIVIIIITITIGKNMFANVLTKEKVEFIESYDGKGVEKMKQLHEFQRPKTRDYRLRKFWLSVNGIHEWDVCEDELSNIYFRNNVSGDTSWKIPKVSPFFLFLIILILILILILN